MLGLPLYIIIIGVSSCCILITKMMSHQVFNPTSVSGILVIPMAWTEKKLLQQEAASFYFFVVVRR